MAIVVPIITDYSDTGLRNALRDIKQAETPMGKLSAATSLIGPALATAATAAGIFAIKMGIDGVQAAIDEERELGKLSTTLKNLGWADQTDNVIAFADQMARLSTFDDSAIRTAFETIAQTAPDAATAMDLVKVAMDTSIGSGKDLDTVATNLSKALGGNTTALERMFPWLGDVTESTGGMDAATKKLAERFEGQAATAADTWDGKLGNVKEAFDELKEAFGKGFLDGLASATGSKDGGGVTGLTDALYDLQPILEDIGTLVGETAGELIIFIQNVKDIKGAFDDWYETLDGPWKTVFDALGDATLKMLNPLKTVLDAVNGLIDAFKTLFNVGSQPVPSPSGRVAVPSATALSAMTRSGPVVNVSVNAGMILDPVAASRTINRILAQGAARQGIGP